MLYNTAASRDEFSFWFPIEKAGETPEGDRILRGIASNEDWDMDGESVLQRGLNIDYLKSRGFINWDHGKGPSAVIGEPIKADITKKGLYVEGRLYKGDSAPEAEAAWNLAKTLESNHSSRKLGWSIQGKVQEKDKNSGKVLKAVVFHVALTHQPKNATTFAEIAKSFATGEEYESSIAVPTSDQRSEGLPPMTQLLKSEVRSPDGSVSREWHPIALFIPVEKALTAGYATAAELKTGGRAETVEDLEGGKKDSKKKKGKFGDSADSLKTTSYKSLIVDEEQARGLIRTVFPAATNAQCRKIIAFANKQ